MLLTSLIFLFAISSPIASELVEIECPDCYPTVSSPENLEDTTWHFLCAKNCSKIRMEGIPFPRFPRELLVTNPDAADVQLYNAELEEMAFGDCFNADRMTSLTVVGHKTLKALRDNCFWGAFELKVLRLDGNDLEVIEAEAFNGLSKLDELGLRETKIKKIVNAHFRPLTMLRFVDLSLSTLEEIESEAFLYNENIDHISIQWSNLTEVDLLLPKLSFYRLSINDNQLKKFSLRSLQKDFAEDEEEGIWLYIDTNVLTGDVYVQPNINIHLLFLYQNPIDNIYTLPVLRSVKRLNLQWCEVKSLDGQRFADKYVNLKTLHMTGNNLTSFSKDTFAGLDKLEILAMDINQLTEIDLPRLESLTSLDVKNNSLTEFPYGEDIRDTFPALKDLNLRNNAFDAEYLAELVKTLQAQGVKVQWETVPWTGSEMETLE